MPLTKAQRIRKFQAERRYAIAHGQSFAKTFEKYDPSQPRDERGRWTDTGATGASASTRRTGDGIRSNAGARAYANVTVNNAGWGPAIATGLLTAAGAGGAAYLLRGRLGALRTVRRGPLGGGARGGIGAGPIVPPVPPGGAAARATRLSQTRMRPVQSTKPPIGGSKPKPTAKPPVGTRDTKPYGEISRRQQQRRESIVRADAIARGATPKQADDLVGQMRARAAASQRTATGLSQARPQATITTPQAVAVEQSRIAAEVARYQAALTEYEALAAKGILRTDDEVRRRTYLFNEMDGLARSIADRERALGRPQRIQLPKLRASKKRLTKASPSIPTESETAASAVASMRAGSAATDAYTMNTTHTQVHGPDPKPKKPAIPEEPEPPPPRPKTGFGSITFKVHGGRSTTTIRKYREDQRRDEQGQFADEGKGGGGGRSVASFNRNAAGLADINTEAQARAYTTRANEQLAAMSKLPSSAWADPTALDKAWDAYIRTMGAVAFVGGVLAGGVKIIGTPNAVAIYYGLLGVKVSAKRLASTLNTAGKLLRRLGQNWKAVGHGFLASAAFGAAKVVTPGQSIGAALTASSWNSAVLSQLATMPRTKAVTRAILTQVSLPRLITAGKVAAGVGALLATAQGLRYGYRMIQSHGEYRGTDETKRRLETIEQHLAALRRLERG